MHRHRWLIGCNPQSRPGNPFRIYFVYHREASGVNQVKQKKAIVIGAGFSGLSSAAVLAQSGFSVTVIEKNMQPGGRARVLRKDGFSFDMGPSWYWMPEIAELFFKRFGRTSAEFFQLKRLDPSYQVIYSADDVFPVPADFEELKKAFEHREKGSAAQLERFMEEARRKYEISITDFIYKPGLSWLEFAHWRSLKAAISLRLFKSFSAHIKNYFKSPELLRLLEFPVLFLGAMPQKIPALYSMMNYADMKLGTWYPVGGFCKLAEAMKQVAEENGVSFCWNTEVTSLAIQKSLVSTVITTNGDFEADVVLGSADYHHIEQRLLPLGSRRYSSGYWNKRTLAPSCLIYYVGVDKRLPRLLHHNLFFEKDFKDHAQSIYLKPGWPKDPLYYVCCPSKTDPTVAPEGMENLFILIPVAPGLEDNDDIRNSYFEQTIKRLEEFCQTGFRQNIISVTSYANSDFVADYNAFKGNAYGLANTLSQTAVLKPAIINKKVKNLFYAGQLTVPGPGVPPAIISGQLVADYISKLNW
jgi:phytoene desaturase